MTNLTIGRPEPTEYAPYYEKYVSLVPEDDVVSGLDEQGRTTLDLLRGLEEEGSRYRYAPGKWSIKEVAGHIIDTERVMAYRALYFGRRNEAAVPGFDQDVTAGHAPYDRLPLSEILDEYESVRRSSLHLFRHFDKDAWLRRGAANNNEVTVRALAYVILGHERHHVEILRSRYIRTN